MTEGEKVRLNREIYQANTGPDKVTTEGVVEGCREAAKELLSKEFVEMVRQSPFYIPGRKAG
jgi:hypothetical protein